MLSGLGALGSGDLQSVAVGWSQAPICPSKKLLLLAVESFRNGMRYKGTSDIDSGQQKAERKKGSRERRCNCSVH